MKLDMEDICDCADSGDFDSRTTNAAILKLLCNMAGISNDSSTVRSSSTAFGSITGSYAVALVTPDPVKDLIVQNTTDQPVYVSFDGTTNAFIVNAGSEKHLVPGDYGGSFTQASIRLKAVGSNPSSGQVLITAIS